MNNILNLRGFVLTAGFLVSVLPLASHASHFDEGLVYYSQGAYQQAFAQFDLAVKAGEAGADYMLMKMHSEGHGAQGASGTFPWALKAAQSGIAQAQYQLAEMYTQGIGTAIDHQQAFHWYRQAAQQGYPLAMQQLGRSYDTGMGVAKNAEQAQRWYSIAASELDVFAQKGDPESQNRLASLYETGKGVKTNPQTAVAWYRQAALQGLADAQYNLGRMLAYGDVERNPAQATYWLRLAANRDHKAARAALAQLSPAGSADVAYIAQP